MASRRVRPSAAELEAQDQHVRLDTIEPVQLTAQPRDRFLLHGRSRAGRRLFRVGTLAAAPPRIRAQVIERRGAHDLAQPRGQPRLALHGPRCRITRSIASCTTSRQNASSWRLTRQASAYMKSNHAS
jgi:hypothetical protein